MINQFEYSNKGVESWQINNGRYANDSSAVFVFKNYSVYVREILKTYGESSILASPVSQYIDSYSFSYGGSFNNNFRIFRFELNKTNKKIILPQKGTLIIDIDTDEIVEINGTITKSLGVKKTFFPYRTRNVVVDFTISYDKGLFMYSQINTSFNIYKLFVKKHTVSVKSFFVNLHEKIEKEEKSMYGSRASDLSKIKQTIYNPLYWTNSAVLRLSEEDDIIEIFENLNLFNND